jgi:hypothetical protein
MEYVLALFGLLLGALGWNFVKRRSAEALLQNNETKSKLNEQDKNKAKNDGLLAAEDKRREELEKDADARKKEDLKSTDF